MFVIVYVQRLRCQPEIILIQCALDKAEFVLELIGWQLF